MAESSGNSGQRHEGYDQAVENLPAQIPKSWVTICETCLLHYIQNFQVRDCPTCKPARAVVGGSREIPVQIDRPTKHRVIACVGFASAFEKSCKVNGFVIQRIDGRSQVYDADDHVTYVHVQNDSDLDGLEIDQAILMSDVFVFQGLCERAMDQIKAEWVYDR